MKKFERLIIYPLLILALFYSMAGDRIMTNAKQVYDEIVAKSITIVNDEGDEKIKITTDSNNGHSIILYEGVIQGINGSEFGIYNENKQLILSMTPNGGNGGKINIYNKHGNEVIYIGQTAPDDKGNGGHHGLINIYDKYGEDYKSYSYKY